MGNGVEDLLFQCGRATVPKEVLGPAHVDESHGVACALRACDSRGDRIGIGKRKARQVTGTAAHGAVGTQPFFPKQKTSQFYAFLGHRIVRRDVHRGEEGRDFDFVRGGARRCGTLCRRVGSATGNQGQYEHKPARDEAGQWWTLTVRDGFHQHQFNGVDLIPASAGSQPAFGRRHNVRRGRDCLPYG